LSGEQHFWQKRYYDFNLRNYPQFVEKLRCIHRNPVKAGLCERPEDWEWSSFRHYATGCEGRVEIESEWTARKRERAAGTLFKQWNGPTQAKTRLEGATGRPIGNMLSARYCTRDSGDGALLANPAFPNSKYAPSFVPQLSGNS